MQKYNYCFKFTVLLKVAFYAKCFLFCKLSISDPKDTKKKGHNLRFKICSTLKKFNQPQSTLNAYKSENIYSMNVNFADDIFVQKSQLMLNGIGENMFSVVVVCFFFFNLFDIEFQSKYPAFKFLWSALLPFTCKLSPFF